MNRFRLPWREGRVLDEREIVRHCDARVLRRARNLARADDAVFDRHCSYEAGEHPKMVLSAHVSEGQGRFRDYDVRISIDEDGDVVSSYECTCQASVAESGMCKHTAAVALAFLSRPESFRGWSASATRASSAVLSRMLRSALRQSASDVAAPSIDPYVDPYTGMYNGTLNGPATSAFNGPATSAPDSPAASDSPAALDRTATPTTAGPTTAAGSPHVATGVRRGGIAGRVREVRLKLIVILTASADGWGVRLRVGRGGISYAVRDISSLPRDVASGAHVTYGENLEVSYRNSVFDPASAGVLSLVERAIAVRTELAGPHAIRHRDGSTADLALTVSEVTELLELCRRGVEVRVDDVGTLGHKPARTPIVEGDPPVRLEFREDGDGFSLSPEARMLVLRSTSCTYAYYQRALYRCESGFEEAAELLETLLESTQVTHFLGASDVTGFCTLVLPALERHVEVVIPDSMRAMRPAPCVIEVYLDCEAGDVLCRARARYGERSHDLLSDEPIESTMSSTASTDSSSSTASTADASTDTANSTDASTADAGDSTAGDSGSASDSGAPDGGSVEFRDARSEQRARRLLSRWLRPAPAPTSGSTSPTGNSTAPTGASSALTSTSTTSTGSSPVPADGVVWRASGPGEVGPLVVNGLPEMRRWATVYTTSAFDSLISRRRVRPVVGLSMKSGLIDLSVSADDLDSRELAEVLASYHEHRSFHRLADGTYLDLAAQDLSGVDSFLGELDIGADGLAAGEVLLPTYRAFQIDALAGESPDVRVDPSLRDYLASASEGTVKGVHEVPASLEGVLRPYQEEGFRWLSGLADAGLGGILADEMGLGKSLQLISYLVDSHTRQARGGLSLIVCPASLVYNWVNEFRTFAPEMSVGVIAGGRDERAIDIAALRDAVQEGLQPPYDIVITSYDLLKRDAAAYEGIVFFCIAVDEAHYIKNAGTLAARSVKSLAATHRFALTGTPVENRLAELWSIFDFLMPGLLGTYDSFRERFEYPIVADGDPDAFERLRQLTGRFILRRVKTDVASDLPPKSTNVVYARMGEGQRRIYDAREQALRESISKGSAQGGTANRVEVLAEITRLRELCCDPRLVYDDYDEGSAKLDTICELVCTALDAGKKTLLFSQFTRYLDLISTALDERGIGYYTITGDTPKKRRVELVDAFNADSTPVFLVSLRAGGTGLNLTGATVVIHADPWWNAAAENQATDRAHRIGQTRAVTVYKVIVENTIEDRVVELQAAKSELAGKVVGDEGAPLPPLTEDDILALLGE